MVPAIFFGLAFSVLVATAAVVALFLETALAGPQRSAARSPLARSWRPPLAPRPALLAWATATAQAAVARRLAQDRTANTARELASEMYAGAACAMAQGPLASRPSRPDCTQNCHAMIGVTAPEALALADELRGAMRAGDVRAVRERAESNAALVADLDSCRYASEHTTCPLLSAGETCCAYDARPPQCRDWSAVEEDAGEGDSAAPRLSGSVLAYASTLCEGVERGLSAGLQEAGLDGRRYELNGALAVALATPHAAQRWVQGEPIFADCKLYE